MIVRIVILRKKLGMTDEAFHNHWRTGHGEIIAKLQELRKYHHSYLEDKSQLGIEFSRSTQQIDGFAHLWFDDTNAMDRSFRDKERLRIIKADEKRFSRDTQVILAKQKIVKVPPKGTGYIKRISLIKRRTDVNEDEFNRHWQDHHASFVKQMPGVEGYVQNIVIDRSVSKGKTATYKEVPFDGLSELWFKDREALLHAFNSPAGQEMTKHAESFIEEVTTFLVNTHTVL